jgi:laminin EGF domain protein
MDGRDYLVDRHRPLAQEFEGRMKVQTVDAVQRQNPMQAPMQAGPVLQRKCACGTHTMGASCEECTKKQFNLQRKLMIGSRSGPGRWFTGPQLLDPTARPPALRRHVRQRGFRSSDRRAGAVGIRRPAGREVTTRYGA